MKSWDIVIAGAGVIGLAIAWRARRAGLRVLIAEKGEPAREASWAAGGMIAHCDPHLPSALRTLAFSSAALYPEFVHELKDESGESADLRNDGTLAFFEGDVSLGCEGARRIAGEEISALEPALENAGAGYFLPEASVDPRALGSALVKAAKHRGVDFVTGSAVTEIEAQNGRAIGVKTTKSSYAAGVVINCAGAWAAQLKPAGLPVYPAKGQMLSVVPAPQHASRGPQIRHVVRTPEIYIIPRSDGRILLGATVEDAGFDKRTEAETIQKLHRAAAEVAPVIGEMRMHEAWAGLRPASPDQLPILGETSLAGYFAATGHYRDGIMLAPITAKIITDLLTGVAPEFDVAQFSPQRFG